MNRPDVCVLKTDGINCDAEMAYAFRVAGAQPEIIHVNQLRSGSRRLDEFAVLAIPGGFSYGDDIASGKVLATELTSFLSDQIETFAAENKPIVGVCNGFQVLTRTGLLPNKSLGQQQATLAGNESGRFECRWIDLAVGASVCKFVDADDFKDQTISMQTAHGEGRFQCSDQELRQLTERGQIVFRYANPDLSQPVEYPNNPNGALDDIAGICDPGGLILGMMPHPERSLEAFHPDRSRTEAARSAAQAIFKGIVSYAEQS